ncbi:MAG: c-type cytochrome [Chitinophagaceae bacterium]|nr:c-type cytochrome [Chitinophagaceae bacterium]
MKPLLIIVAGILLLTACNTQPPCTPAERNKALESIDSLSVSLNWPKELSITGYTGPDITPSPACIAATPTGEVYVGVDMMGSLGKHPGKGLIVKLTDCNNDGIVDSHTEYARVDNPRGIISIGDKLYVLHTTFKDTLAEGMDLVVFEDKDHDGKADGGPQPLIEHISNPTYLKSRGTDHATNGIRLGIDGWIYIAVGDFGFHDATDRSGRKLTMLGGGIVRVRPDGTEMEVYSHGLRNIYDVAIDPYMNIFTRDNTNDGGGWNIRFSHQLQTGEYGYPLLFKHFTEEIIPALEDLGGGSGTGSLFMSEPGWPQQYNNVPMMADWGRSHLYIHRLTPDGASYKQQQEEFIKLPQITDLDVDGSGRLYMAAWDGAGYTGDSSKGFIVRAVPQNWTYTAFPDVTKASLAQLRSLLQSNSAVARQAAQQELLTRNPKEAPALAWELASDVSQPADVRIAAMYTYSQIAKEAGIPDLVKLAAEPAVKEYVFRVLTDREPFLENVPVQPFVDGLKDTSVRVQVAAIIALNRLNKTEAAQALLDLPVPASFVAPAKGQEGPHATPNADIIPAHLAVRALVHMNAVEPCLAAITTNDSTIALWALRYMHDPRAVDGLIAAYNATGSSSLREKILVTLSRLYEQESPFDATTWWSTRPDTHGPYYKPRQWEASDKIRTFLTEQWNKTNKAGKAFFADLNGKFRLGITQFGGEEPKKEDDEVKVDLDKIRNSKGQIGKSSIEDIMLAMDKIKGDPALGKKLFVQQGCMACHSIEKGQPLKGPFMGQIGSIMNRKQIAESILKPNASISQGFSTVQITTNDNKTVVGFVTGESGGKVSLRDITGSVHTVLSKDIKERRELETSIMPPGLANALSYEEFASLITYLSQQKGDQ